MPGNCALRMSLKSPALSTAPTSALKPSDFPAVCGVCGMLTMLVIRPSMPSSLFSTAVFTKPWMNSGSFVTSRRPSVMPAAASLAPALMDKRVVFFYL